MIDNKSDALADTSRSKNVAVIAGHMFRGSELDATTQVTIETEIRAHAERLFACNDVGIVFGALACGADIILAEMALKHGARIEAVLPFASQRFVETSVQIGDPPGQPGKWETRFQAILNGAYGPCALTVMEPSGFDVEIADDFFLYGFRYAAGCALQRAAMTASACKLIAVSDASDADSIAGTNSVLADWRSHHRAFDVIPYPYSRRARVSHERHKTSFKPVICLKDTGPRADGSFLEMVSEQIGQRVDVMERANLDGGRHICLLFRAITDAIEAANLAMAAARRETHALHVICDFGYVLGTDLRLDRELVDRRQAVRSLPDLPTGEVFATEAFTAQAKYDLGDDVTFVPALRAETEDSAQGQLHAKVRSRSSLPIFALASATLRTSDR